MRKCVDWNNGVRKILLQVIKAHMDSSIVTARGTVERTNMFSGKESPVKTLVFTNTRSSRDTCQGDKVPMHYIAPGQLYPLSLL